MHYFKKLNEKQRNIPSLMTTTLKTKVGPASKLDHLTTGKKHQNLHIASCLHYEDNFC